MQQAQSQGVNEPLRLAGLLAAAARPWAYLCELLPRQDRVEHTPAARYRGRAWCGSREPEMSQDIIASGRPCW
jgi:hypothetical protein